MDDGGAEWEGGGGGGGAAVSPSVGSAGRFPFTCREPKHLRPNLPARGGVGREGLP